MKVSKKILYTGLALLVAGLMCIQASANIWDQKKITTTPNGVSNIPNTTKVPFKVLKTGKNSAAISAAGNILVGGDPASQDLNPTLTIDQAGRIVLAWSASVDVLTENLGFGYSTDGTTFTTYSLASSASDIWINNAVSYVKASRGSPYGTYNGLWGVYQDLTTEQRGFYSWPNIADVTNISLFSWTTPSVNPTYATISDDNWFYEGTYNFGTGPTNVYISNQDLCTLDECPELMYMDYANNSGSGTIDCGSVLMTSPGSHPSYVCIHDSNPVQTADDAMYYTQEYKGSDPHQIVYKLIQPSVMADIEYAAVQRYVAEGTCPNIGGIGDKVVIVYMNGGNILALYSSDKGVTFQTSTIGPGSYPSVFMDSTNVSCAYVNNGNLYLVKSSDGGATWKTPEQINDVAGKVVAEENAICVRAAGIVWEDTRNGDQKDIYFYKFNLPGAPNIPSKPAGTASGKVGTEYTYTTSTTDPAGGQVSYLFDWGDGTNSGWVGPFASGAQASAKKTWSAKGSYSIKVKAKGTTGAESDWSDPLPVTMPCSYNINARFWEQLFARFPHALPILRHLLGY